MGYVFRGLQELKKVATPKVKYDRSYTESVLWLLVLFFLLLLFIVPFWRLIDRADTLSFFYTENAQRSMKCGAFLKNEIDKLDPSFYSNEGSSSSSGEAYFNAMFPEENAEMLIKNGQADCDLERNQKRSLINLN